MQNLNMVKKDPSPPDNLRGWNFVSLMVWEALKENLCQDTSSNPCPFFGVLILCRPEFAAVLPLNPTLKGLCLKGSNDRVLKCPEDGYVCVSIRECQGQPDKVGTGGRGPELRNTIRMAYITQHVLHFFKGFWFPGIGPSSNDDL